MSVGSRCVPKDLSQDGGTTGLGSFEFFDHQHTRCFGGNEAVAVSIKWSALARTGQRCHVLKASETYNGGGTFGAARDHGVASIPPDHIERVANALVTCCACGHRGLTRALEAVLHGDVCR